MRVQFHDKEPDEQGNHHVYVYSCEPGDAVGLELLVEAIKGTKYWPEAGRQILAAAEAELRETSG